MLIYLRAGLLLLLLLMFWTLGASWQLLAFLAVFFALVLLFRDKVWKWAQAKMDGIALLHGRPGWVRWLLLLVVFLAAYFVFKTVVYSIMRTGGYDVEGEMLGLVNASAGNTTQ